MFRIDSEHVVDATRNGGLARYSEISLALPGYFILYMINIVVVVYMFTQSTQFTTVEPLD